MKVPTPFIVTFLLVLFIILNGTLSPHSSFNAEETIIKVLTYRDHINNQAWDGFTKSLSPINSNYSALVNNAIPFNESDYMSVSFNDSMKKNTWTGASSCIGYPYQVYNLNITMTEIKWFNIKWIGHGISYRHYERWRVEIHIFNNLKWEFMNNYSSNANFNDVLLERNFTFANLHISHQSLAVLIWNDFGEGNSTSDIYTNYIEVTIGYQDQDKSNEIAMIYVYVAVPIAIIILVIVLFLFIKKRKNHTS